MDRYQIVFQADTYGAKFHESYLTAIENGYAGVIKRELKRHRYSCGSYTALVRLTPMKNPRTTEHHILLSCSHSIHIYVLHESNRMTVMSLNLAFSADHMAEDSADKRFKWIDPTQDILKHSPKFTTHACYTLPSQDEIEMQSREAAERFIKSFERFRFPFHKSDFPIKKIRIR